MLFVDTIEVSGSAIGATWRAVSGRRSRSTRPGWMRGSGWSICATGVAFAEGHVAGSFDFEAEGQLATYLAWPIPWGKPVTLLAEPPEQLASAQRELVRVDIDRPAAVATGGPTGRLRAGETPGSVRRATFTDLAGCLRDGVVVLDVRRAFERTDGFVEGSLHIPIHTRPRRLDEVPEGEVRVHCAGGMRAAIAASLLDAVGRDAVAVDDSFETAEKAGLTLRAS